MFKGPEAKVCLVCSRKSKVIMAGVEKTSKKRKFKR